MTATPLWLALKIKSGKERRAHEAFEARGIVSFYAHEIREKRLVRVRRPMRYEVPLLTSYALVAHNGEVGFLDALRAIQWPFSDMPVAREIMGPVPTPDVERLIAISGRLPDPPTPKLFLPGEAVKVIDGLLQGRSARIIIHKGNKVRVEIDGREVHTTADKLEAA